MYIVFQTVNTNWTPKLTIKTATITVRERSSQKIGPSGRPAIIPFQMDKNKISDE